MGMSDYVRRLRERIGHDLLLTPSVACLIRDEEGRILHVHSVEGRWMLPGGAVDPGESPAEAAARECLEEAGIVVEPLRILGVFGGPPHEHTYANGDRVAWVITVFEARLVEGEPKPSDDETDDVGWFAPDELDALERAPATRETMRRLLAGDSFA